MALELIIIIGHLRVHTHARNTKRQLHHNLSLSLSFSLPYLYSILHSFSMEFDTAHRPNSISVVDKHTEPHCKP